MIVMMPRMISPGSLAAFSASIAASLPSARAGAVPGLTPVRDQVVTAPFKPQAAPQSAAPVQSPSSRLPRGSLLDLQV